MLASLPITTPRSFSVERHPSQPAPACATAPGTTPRGEAAEEAVAASLPGVLSPASETV